MNAPHRSEDGPAVEATRLLFLDELRRAVAGSALLRLVLAKPLAPTPGPDGATVANALRVGVRELSLHGERVLSFVATHPTRDVTTNLSLHDGLSAIGEWLGRRYAHAHLFTTTEEIELRVSRKGRLRPDAPARRTGDGARRAGARPRQAAPRRHRPALPRRPRRHRCRGPAGAGDGAQVEADQQVRRGLRSRACATSPLRRRQPRPRGRLRLGQGLPHLRDPRPPAPRLGREAEVTGVELRPDLVALCNAAAQRAAR